MIITGKTENMKLPFGAVIAEGSTDIASLLFQAPVHCKDCL